jgi:hypothetical protein
MIRCAPVNSLIPHLATFIGGVGEVLSLLLVFAVFRRKTYRILRSLAAYLIVLIPKDAVLSVIWYKYAPASVAARHLYFYSYWITSYILTMLRTWIVFEICFRILRSYRAVWSVAWRLLAAVTAILCAWTGYSVVRQIHDVRKYIPTLQQRLDLIAAILVLLVIALGTYYRREIARLYWLMLIGACVYSCIELADDEVLRFVAKPPLSIIDLIQRFAYAGMLGLWIWAVLSPAMASARERTSATSGATYDELSSEVHSRLRELNERLGLLTRQ